jgi:hypothetical protein
MPRLTPQERATVLAALEHWRRTMAPLEHCQHTEAILRREYPALRDEPLLMVDDVRGLIDKMEREA